MSATSPMRSSCSTCSPTTRSTATANRKLFGEWLEKHGALAVGGSEAPAADLVDSACQGGAVQRLPEQFDRARRDDCPGDRHSFSAGDPGLSVLDTIP